MKTVCLLFVLTAAAAAEMWIPEGTPVRVRLDKDLPQEMVCAAGQPAEFSVIEEVRVQGRVAIAVGAQAMGTQVLTAGDKDHKPSVTVTIDRVRAMDGSWIPLRYAAKRNGESGLIRIDALKERPADPRLLLPRGATFALYVDDSPAAAAVASPAAEKQYPSILKWLISEADPGLTAAARCATWLSVGGCLLVLLGAIHQRREDRRF